VEQSLCALEHAKHALIVTSGTAAAMLVAYLLKPGEQMIGPGDFYCGLVKSFDHINLTQGAYHSVNFHDEAALRAAITPKTKVASAMTST
jgi:O-acetylhomoserine/O-acetylserine sulfhydrylase-like pyridoxal-dependent enzyme